MNFITTDFAWNASNILALVQLEEGPLVTAQLTNSGDKIVKIVMPV